METCPSCHQPLVPFRAKLVCRTPGCGFMESCCDGGWMDRAARSGDYSESMPRDAGSRAAPVGLSDAAPRE